KSSQFMATAGFLLRGSYNKPIGFLTPRIKNGKHYKSHVFANTWSILHIIAINAKSRCNSDTVVDAIL
ncbi:hypothetical protein, partial [Acinetobacter baumannii]|uniref:hypothetical protein n=1 Tax=Acinetobacter baumannii TaxID=470 RepID=UPI001C076AA3